MLRSESTRADYDDMLANPQNYMRNRMKYYKNTVANKADPVTVVVTFVVCLTAFHFWYISFRSITIRGFGFCEKE